MENSSAEAKPSVGAIYRHFKGSLYRVISTKLMSHDETECVLYQPLYDSEWLFFSRPISQWFEEVAPGVQRFTLTELTPAEARLFEEVPALRSGQKTLEQLISKR